MPYDSGDPPAVESGQESWLHGWNVIDVSDWEVIDREPVGSSDPLWLAQPGSESTLWLHKSTVIPTNGEEQGEDWAEAVSTRIAQLLGVPCAQARLCRRKGRRGSISLSLNAEGYSLVHGGDWLEAAGVPEFENWQQRSSRGHQRRSSGGTIQRGHNLENIRDALAHVKAPLSLPDDLTAFDAFAGYLLLDAIIANRDRHEFNWAVMQSLTDGQPDRLCPSFDHGTTLGHNLSDHKRRTCDREAFSRRATAHRFEHTRKKCLTLTELSIQALTMASPSGRGFWTHQLARSDLSRLELQTLRLDGVSEVTAIFIDELVTWNVRRLKDAIDCGQR